jgi:hypothetical protein
MPAPPLADVLVRDAHPPVPLGVGDHLLDQVAISLLDIDPIRELGARLVQPRYEGVAHRLEVGYPEHSRSAGRGNREIDSTTGKSRGEQLAELPLKLADLTAKVAAGTTLNVVARSSPAAAKRRSVEARAARCRLAVL